MWWNLWRWPLEKGVEVRVPVFVSILIIGVAKGGKMWAEGPYLHTFANLGRPPFSHLVLSLKRLT